ncbi:uncharacterized protein LOC129312201 [Prosopis cineraria]|uniref:uncharacterized protein LOC129312201 n=1 Tax=Prosopis cineraria TaxID=364024 RepID=UPI00240EDABF|nr:uncharacterized protein LOC129312201 [Prosopis cineraria]
MESIRVLEVSGHSVRQKTARKNMKIPTSRNHAVAFGRASRKAIPRARKGMAIESRVAIISPAGLLGKLEANPMLPARAMAAPSENDPSLLSMTCITESELGFFKQRRRSSFTAAHLSLARCRFIVVMDGNFKTRNAADFFSPPPFEMQSIRFIFFFLSSFLFTDILLLFSPHRRTTFLAVNVLLCSEPRCFCSSLCHCESAVISTVASHFYVFFFPWWWRGVRGFRMGVLFFLYTCHGLGCVGHPSSSSVSDLQRLLLPVSVMGLLLTGAAVREV